MIGVDDGRERTRFNAVFAGLWPAGGDAGVDGWLTITDRRIRFRPRGLLGNWGALLGALGIVLVLMLMAAWLAPALVDHTWAVAAPAGLVFLALYRWLGRRLARAAGTDLPLDRISRVGTARPPFSAMALEVILKDGRRYLLRAVNLGALRRAMTAD